MIFNFTKDAKTLEGHDAEYFAPLSLLVAQKMPVGTDLNDCREVGTYYFDSYATNYVNAPSDTAHNGIMVVRKQSDIRLVQEYVAINTGVMYVRTAGNASTWNEWKALATLSDLANALATKLANYLPLAGGKIENSNPHALGVGNTSSDLVLPYYRGVSGLLGYLGFNGENNPIFATKAGLLRPLLHSMNYSDYALPKTGGDLHPTANIGHTIGQTGGSAVGSVYRNADGSQAGGIGLLGFDGVAHHMYIGLHGDESYSTDYGLAIYEDNITWKNKQVHHDGNSAKVVISETAPSDTSDLWVY